MRAGRVADHEADRVERVLRVGADLAQQGLEHRPAADEHGPLASEPSPRQVPDRGAHGGYEQEAGEGEDEDLAEHQLVDRSNPKADPGGEKADQKGVEQRGQLVEHAVIDPLLVEAVEAVETKEGKPDGKHGQDPDDVTQISALNRGEQ